MSLKGVELQIAIPKTFDAGKVAEKNQQRIQMNQESAHNSVERQALKNRETVLEAEEFAKTDADKKNRDDAEAQERKKREQKEEKNTKHPYKGAFVDFTG